MLRTLSDFLLFLRNGWCVRNYPQLCTDSDIIRPIVTISCTIFKINQKNQNLRPFFAHQCYLENISLCIKLIEYNHSIK